MKSTKRKMSPINVSLKRKMSFKCIFREEEFTYFRPLTHHIMSGWSEDFTLKVWKI